MSLPTSTQYPFWLLEVGVSSADLHLFALPIHGFLVVSRAANRVLDGSVWFTLLMGCATERGETLGLPL